MDEAGRDTLVSVCVCTFRRPRRLAGLLDALSRLDPDPEGTGIEVVVVDNDAAASARPVAAEAAAAHPRLRLHYVVEAEQNISLARNRCVREATGSWIAFIDDDEAPEPRWLASLLASARRWRADGVFGPVEPVYPAAAPAWILRGGFYRRPRHGDGETVPEDELRTGNALLRRSLLDAPRGPFDPSFGLSGGEDSELLGRLQRQGARFVWCDGAVVHERLGDDRLSLRWLWLRSFRSGQTWIAVRDRGPADTALHAAQAVVVVVVGAVVALPALLAGRHRAAWWWLKVARNLGKLSGLLGARSEMYRAPEGSRA